jgi:iron-sulfur cluster assembly accessory protein
MIGCSFLGGLNMSEATQTELLLTVTEDAARQVCIVRSKEPENADKTLRVFVEEGGCSGLQYGMVFDEKRDDDHALEFFGETVLVDNFSADYLRGAVVDYHDGLNDAGFKIRNPNAKQSCGCGNSFET